MIKSLGFKRVAVLVVLGGLCLFVGALQHLYFAPQALKSANDLNAANAESAALIQEVETMRKNYDFFLTQKDVFEKMNRLGFFAGQDRVLARERFDSIQKMSKIISARYEIKAASMMAEEEPEEETFLPDGSPAPQNPFAVMQSPVTVTLSALDDLDIYRFIYFLNYGFPGHVTIDTLNIERKEKLDPDVLKKIGQGTPPDIVSAQMNITWRTMSRKDTAATNSEPQPLDVGVTQ